MGKALLAFFLAVAMGAAVAADLKLYSATVDAGTGAVSIRGANLVGPGSLRTQVLFGASMTPLTITGSSATEIQAFLPAAVAPGTYKLVVGFGLGDSQFDQLDV